MSKTMVYKFPGPFPLQDGGYDYKVVADEDIQAATGEGWHLTPMEARAAHESEQAAKAAKAAKKSKAEE